MRAHPIIRYDALIKNADNTNSRHLELYTVLGEYDNVGFPLSYCLLTTATSVEDKKRTKALEAWAAALRDEYGIVPRFIHTDKDMAEIGASCRVWPEAKHQLCWWHQREALRRRLKGNLPTSAYNPQRAAHEHAFIDTTFKPYGRVDLKDCEGGVPGEICEQEVHEKCHGSTCDAYPQGRPGVARPSDTSAKNIGRKERQESRRKHVDRSDGSGREY